MSSDVGARLNWDAVRDEATRHLQRLIQCETVNPPGNETLVAQYLKDVVEREGLGAYILEAEPQRGNFVTRIKGSGNAPPILLMAHADVVSVEAEKWTHPPFAGAVEEGVIWGRGAVDTKNLVAAELMVILLIARENLQLDRDLIMVTFADEEAGSRLGARWMWQEHRALIDAEYAINEGGGDVITVGGKRFYLCQTGEKGGARMRVIARAEPGHASMPRDDTAMLRVARAIEALTTHVFPTEMTRSVQIMLQTLAETLGGDHATLIEEIKADPTWEKLQLLPTDDFTKVMVRAMTRNTAVPTIVHGGHRINVIPGEIVLDVDGRVLPGVEPANFVAQVRELLGPDVIVEPTSAGSSGIEADPDSPFFDTIRAVIGDLDPEAAVTPYLVPGGTDARALPGVKVYGFAPGRYDPPMMVAAHNHDERISVESLAFQTRALFDIVTRSCSARPVNS
jgi:acetylornithine deacetylase/succinyl-diaminopimelate desuccinylase-like protein